MVTRSRSARAVACVVAVLTTRQCGDSFVLMTTTRTTTRSRGHLMKMSRRLHRVSVVRPEKKMTVPSESPLQRGVPPKNDDSNSEFELNKGRACDALRSDFETFWERPLEWSIYRNDVEVIDPSGFQIKGVTAYKAALFGLRLFKSVATDHVEMLRLRLRYDHPARVIEAQWYSKWHVKAFKDAYVSGVSHFFLDDQGYVTKHLITSFLVNGREIPSFAEGLTLGLKSYVVAGCPQSSSTRVDDHVFVGASSPTEDPVPAALAAPADVAPADVLYAAADGGALGGSGGGKDPEKGADTKRRTKPKEKGGFMAKCEFVWDCEFPLECCDFVVGKACCGGGEGIPAFLRGIGGHQSPAPLPIPVPVDPRR